MHALYRAQQHQATITATVTDQTPQIIHALIADPRTDHDTAHPERTNPPIAAIGYFSFVIMKVWLAGQPAITNEVPASWVFTMSRVPRMSFVPYRGIVSLT